MVMTVTFQSEDHSNPRLAMVVYGQSPQERIVTDDQGLDFLSLPRAIRDVIYSKVVVKSNSPVGAESRFTKPFYKDAIAWRSLSFAGTCRKVWNESLEVYLALNTFEFFYIRPFLEFLEQIGVRGRRLLTMLKWHHHWRSRPFIVLRLLRSCRNLQGLEVSARVTLIGRKGFWFGVPFLHAKSFFLGDNKKILFGQAIAFGKIVTENESIPNLLAKDAFGVYIERSLRSLTDNLKKVKWELSGHYNRPDLPSIYTNGMCHWKYKMIDETRKRKAEEGQQEQGRKRQQTSEGGSVASGTTTPETCASVAPETSTAAQETHTDSQADIEEDVFDHEDGYSIQDGNLMKDGTLVAKGSMFDEESALADGHLRGDEAEGASELGNVLKAAG